MGKVFTIGEALIDFIPNEKGIELKAVSGFRKAPGGAPANVSAAVSKLGGNSAFIGKLGKDAFGDFLIDTLKDVKVDTNYITRTGRANTGLAFVALREDGEREFSFYRNPSADMLLSKDDIKKDWFSRGDILHFCSVDLIEAPVKYAHVQAIEYIKEVGGLVSFDPNIRKSLWDDLDIYKKIINEFIPYADIVKVSDDELEFITGLNNEKEAVRKLFVGDVKLVLLTRGKDGVTVFYKDLELTVEGFNVIVEDTTGAGDSFIGSFLYQVSKEIGLIDTLNSEMIKEMVTFSNAVAAITTTRKGAISALPTINEVEKFLSRAY